MSKPSDVPPHKPGVLRITAKPADDPGRIEMWICTSCFNDMIDTLRDEGFTGIVVGSPEFVERLAIDMKAYGLVLPA